MKAFKKICDAICWVCKVLLVLLMVGMTVITTIEVVRRYALGKSFAWAEESVRFMLVASSFIGGGYAFREKSLVIFDSLQNRLTGRARTILIMLCDFVVLFISGFVLYFGINYANTPAIKFQKSPGLKLPMTVIYAIICFGMFLLVLFSIEAILDRIGELRHPERLEAKTEEVSK